MPAAVFISSKGAAPGESEKMRHLLIRGGMVVTPDEVRESDILIEGERISQVRPQIRADESDVLDATGLHVLPGLIDAHVHLRDPGATQKEDFTTGTRAALAGGVTTVLDMPNNPTPTTTRVSLEEKRRIAKLKAVCDYGFYVGATRENATSLEEWGSVGVKVYLGATTGDLLLTDFETIYRHFAASHDLPIVVHAEDNATLGYFAQHAVTPRHSARRPPLAAALAVSHALTIAQATNRQLHIAHLSTQAELELVVAARARGARVTFEVTPHHLFLSTNDEERLGPFGVVNPPLRAPEDVHRLWNHHQEWDMVATDHAPHTREEKRAPTPPSGMPGLETMLPLLLTAVQEGQLSIRDIARLTSRNPARIFHLSHKGEIAPGYDADIALVRMGVQSRLVGPWHSRSDWSPFEARPVTGQVVGVFLRGRRVVSNGEIIAVPGSGREVRRTRDSNS